MNRSPRAPGLWALLALVVAARTTTGCGVFAEPSADDDGGIVDEPILDGDVGMRACADLASAPA